MRFFDAHCDAVSNAYDQPFDFVDGDRRGHMDLPRLLRAGHGAQVFAIFAARSYYPQHDPFVLAERASDIIHGWAAASAGRLRVATTGAEVAAAFAPEAAQVAAIIGLEGADPLAGRPEALAQLHARGLRLVIPAWDDNSFSGSSAGPGAGLTPAGYELIDGCRALRIMVDVSHASDAAFAQISARVTGPFIASHSNCRAIAPAARNLTDEQIRALAAHGGALGLNLAPDFLSPAYLAAWDAALGPTLGLPLAERQKARIAAGPQLAAIPLPDTRWVARHARHAIQVGGEDVVGLGGDLDGLSFLPAGMTGVESYGLLVDALAAAGLTARQIEKVCWRNMARVFQAVLP